MSYLTPPHHQFDYAQMPDDLATRAKAVVMAVNALQEVEAGASVRIGIELSAIKAQLGHGLFLRWVEAEFPLSPRMSRYYMKLAARLSEENGKRVSYLPKRLQFKLVSLSVDDGVLEKVIASSASGHPMPPTEVLDLIEEQKAKGDANVRGVTRVALDRQRQLQAKQLRMEKADREVESRRAAESEAAARAAEIVAAAIGDDLPRLVGLLEKADLREFRSNLSRQAK
jgi:hypothetical protein